MYRLSSVPKGSRRPSRQMVDSPICRSTGTATAGTAAAIEAALAQIAGGEGQDGHRHDRQRAPGPIETKWGLGFRDYDECIAYIRANNIEAPGRRRGAAPALIPCYEQPTYSIVPSNDAVAGPGARGRSRSCCARTKSDNRRRSLYFPQVMRDARRISEYHPGSAGRQPGMHGQVGASRWRIWNPNARISTIPATWSACSIRKSKSCCWTSSRARRTPSSTTTMSSTRITRRPHRGPGREEPRRERELRQPCAQRPER